MAMATAQKLWTLRELHSLPDDGNKYELIDGVLYVTPAPTNEHETILARLTRLLDPFVAANGLGFVYHPRAVVQKQGSAKKKSSEVEPDLMVRLPHRGAWRSAPRPTLVVEVLSDSTRRRDRREKRSFYMRIGIPEYWIVDPQRRTVTVVRAGEEDHDEQQSITWSPTGARANLTLQVADIFD